MNVQQNEWMVERRNKTKPVWMCSMYMELGDMMVKLC